MEDKYKLYLYYNDELCVKCKTHTDDWRFFYKELSEKLIKTGLEKYNLKNIQKACKLHCDIMFDKVQNGERLCWDDKRMFIGSYFALYKFNKIRNHNFLFLKIK
jgi:hypothetical protein